jgi:hypothetical protein
MNKMVVLVGGAALVASVVNGGCQSEDEACPGVTGQFEALHYRVDGSCSTVPAIRYELENKTLSTDEVTDAGGMLRTKVNRMGCTLEITRTRLDNAGNEQWQMTGTLDIVDSEKLTGTMTRYEWGADGQIVCQGTYNVIMKML